MKLLGALSARDRKALGFGLAIVLPALGYALLLRPYWHARSDLLATVAAQRDLLRRERALVNESRAFPARVAAATTSARRDAARLFPGTSLVAAGGELVTYVGEAARRCHVQVQTLETRPPARGAPGLARLDIEVRAQGDLEGVLAFLEALERGPRLVRVETLMIERADVAAALRQEALSVAAAVSGYTATVGGEDSGGGP
jgi:hypothetical protein